MMKTALQEKINHLPPELQREVEDFVEFLSERRVDKSDPAPPAGGTLKLAWRGSLRHLRDHFTALELQKQALKEWGG